MATTTSTTDSQVDQILNLAREKGEDESGDREAERQEAALSLVSQLMKTKPTREDEATLQLAFGLFDIPFVLTPRPGDSPAGGRWTKRGGLAQRLFRTRGTFQHLLPVNSTGLTPSTPKFCQNQTSGGWMLAEDSSETNNETAVSVVEIATAEGINMVSLEALFSLIRLTVILRGDAVPLSAMERDELTARSQGPALTSQASRIFFDPPRLFWGRNGRCNFFLGPTSRVVLDTPYVDARIRIGRGGRSNNKFVFRRLSDKDENYDLAQEFQPLLARPPVPKKRLLGWTLLTGLTGVAWSLLAPRRRMASWGGSGLSVVALCTALVLLRFKGGFIMDERPQLDDGVGDDTNSHEAEKK